MDYSKMDWNALTKEENKLRAKYNEIEEECVKQGLNFEEFCEKAKNEREGLYFIRKYKRLLVNPTVEYGKEWKGELYTIEQFKEMVKNGELTDEDGYGYYATQTSKSDLIIEPSDILENIVRDDFSHVIWFNVDFSSLNNNSINF